MIDNNKEYIICAAIWYQDDTEAPRGFIAQNINTGVVIGQWSHPNCNNVRSTNRLWNAKKIAESKGEFPTFNTFEDTLKYFNYISGFLTSKGRFVDRWQGMEIAYLAGQVTEKRAVRENYNGEKYTSEEFQNQEPRQRNSEKDGNGWNMMYSEDLY